jgi:hypothetical protein
MQPVLAPLVQSISSSAFLLRRERVSAAFVVLAGWNFTKLN